jgi:hypothetical protein
MTQSAFDDGPDRSVVPIIATIPRGNRSKRWFGSSAFPTRLFGAGV